MKNILKLGSVCLATTLWFWACGTQSSEERSTSVGPQDWLSGNSEEKFHKLAVQMQGFSAAMMEVSYRYNELYWAGKDENWAYAEHQLEHLEEAIELGLERRPARKKSSEAFMKQNIPAMEEAIASGDQALFLEEFETFRKACNSCHIAEKEEFITVDYPTVRLSPVIYKKDKE